MGASLRPPLLAVCMFSNLYPPVMSGSSFQASSLARELVQLGCNAVVITAKIDSSPGYERIDGVHVYRLPAFRLPRMGISFNFPWLSYTFTLANLRRIEHILRQHHIDVLHLHNHMFDLAFSASWMRRRLQKPLVITVHTVVKHASPLYNMLLSPMDRVLLSQLVVRQADCVICPDINIANYVHEAFGEVDSVLIPYGIGLPQPSQQLVEQLRAQYRLQGKRIILSVGHVHEIRNRRDLVEALPYVLEAFPNAVLVIVGVVATDLPSQLAHELGIQDSVLFTGPASHTEVAALLSMADLEAHWLNQDEPGKTSLGIASLEAMAAGRTVLAAANEMSYGPGVLKNGGNVVLVTPGNPRQLAETMVALLRDEHKRASIGNMARQTVLSHFSWDSVCSQTVQAYKDAKWKCRRP